MTRRSAISLCILLSVMAVLPAVAQKGAATNTFWQPTLGLTSAGVTDDGNNAYLNGVGGVQSYMGAGGNNVNLVTYGTGRRLHFVFSSASTPWRNSGLPQDFTAEITSFGVNYFGGYSTMGVGTTAQVALTIQFKYGNVTYELTWASVAGYHDTATSWLITWRSLDLPGYPGFSPSDQATLSRLRHNSRTTYGVVNMPVRYSVQSL